MDLLLYGLDDSTYKHWSNRGTLRSLLLRETTSGEFQILINYAPYAIKLFIMEVLGMERSVIYINNLLVVETYSMFDSWQIV